MSIKEQLTADMKEAMKAHEKDRLAVIRGARGAIRQAEIDGGHTELDDQAVIGVDKTQAEIDVLMKYLPAQLSEDEVKALVKEAVEKTGAKTQKDMGKVMGALMPKVKGRADGKMVNQLVRSMLVG